MSLESPTSLCPLCGTQTELFLQEQGGRAYHWCDDCDLCFVHPEDRPRPERELAHYRQHENDPLDPHYRAFVAPLAREVEQRHPRGARGLDFGAGPGPALARMLQERGYTVELYDPYFWPDCAFAGQPYDFIVASEVVEHLFHPRDELARLRDRLRDGGTLALMTCLSPPRSQLAAWYYRLDPTHVAFYSRRTFEWIRRELGFAAVDFVSERIVALRR
jgi:hypothetical protein